MEVAQMADGTVTIEVAVNQKEAEKQLSGMAKLGQKAVKGISVAAKAAAGVVTGIGVAAIKTGADFESTMSGVQAISGASAEDMQRLSDTAKEMGRTTVFSASEAGEAMNYMAMAGWKTDQMISGIPGIMNLAAASGEDLAKTSDIVTDGLTAFGLAAEDSGMFADVLAAASNNANTNVSMMGESFKYVGATAGAMGYNVQDVSVALGLMANSGIKAGQAGTTLRAALSKMVKPTKEAAGIMDSLGISLTDQNGEMKSLDEVMQNLRSSLGGLSEDQQTSAAAALFGQEAMAGMLAIVNASEDDYNKLSDAINNAQGSAQRMADIKVNNLQGQFKLLQSSAESFLLSIYNNHLGDAMTDMVKQAKLAVDGLTTAFESGGYSGLYKAGMNMAMNAVYGMTAYIPHLAKVGNSMCETLGSALTEHVSRFITAGFQIVSSLISGIGQMLPTLIPQGLKMVIGLLNSITGNIPKLIAAGVTLIKGLAQGLVNSLPILIAEAPKAINNFANAIYNGLGQLVLAGASMIVQLVKGLWDNRMLLVQNAGEIFQAIMNVFSLANLVSLGKNLIKSITSGVKNAGPNMLKSFNDLVKSWGDTIKKVDWGSYGIKAVKGIAGGIKGAAGAIKSGLKWAGTEGLAAFKSINWVAVGKTAIRFIVNGAKSLAGTVRSALKAIGTKALAAFKSIDWVAVGKGIPKAIANAAKGAKNLVWSALKGIGNTAVKVFKAIPWGSLGKHVVNGIVQGILKAGGQLVGAIKDLAKKAVSAAKDKLKIHSPSRVFRDEVGAMTVRGAIVGVEKEEPELTKTYEDAFQNVTARVTAADLSGVRVQNLDAGLMPETMSVRYETDKDAVRDAVKQGVHDGIEESGIDQKGIKKAALEAQNEANERPIVLDKRKVNRTL